MKMIFKVKNIFSKIFLSFIFIQQREAIWQRRTVQSNVCLIPIRSVKIAFLFPVHSYHVPMHRVKWEPPSYSHALIFWDMYYRPTQMFIHVTIVCFSHNSLKGFLTFYRHWCSWTMNSVTFKTLQLHNSDLNKLRLLKCIAEFPS